MFGTVTKEKAEPEIKAAKMCDDLEPPSMQSNDNLKDYSKSLTEQQTLETISATNLLDLHDDCLDELFSHLDLIELSSVMRVCQRFQRLTELFFKRKYNDIDFSKLFAGRLITNREARNVLRNFGSMVICMTVTRKVFDETLGDVEEVLLKDIVDCCGETLCRLQLQHFYFTSCAVESLNRLSKSLQSLVLVGPVLAEDCVFHLSNFTSLKYLFITDTRDCYALMDLFPALERLRLDKVSIPSESILKHFLVTHKQLKDLTIFCCNGISSNVFRSIGKYLENLKEFIFVGNLTNGHGPVEHIQNDMLHLCELKHLTYFYWNCNLQHVSLIGNILAKMVSNEIAIKFLIIGSVVVDDETIETIKQMKHLKYLSFVQAKVLNEQHLIEIVKVTQLTELSVSTLSPQYSDFTFHVLKQVLCHSKQLTTLRIFSETFPLDLAMYNDILDIVKERRNGIKLTIKGSKSGIKGVIPQQSLNNNLLILKMTETLPF